MKHYIILILLLITFQPCLSQDNLVEGLFFYSHEVKQEKRTSLKLTPEKPIFVKDKITLEFYANFRKGDGYFGNIFKIIGNEEINIDFVGNQNENVDNFWLVVDKEILFSYKWSDIPKGDYYEWIKFKIELNFKNSEIVFSINDYKIKRSAPIIREIDELEIEFGKSIYKKFTTTDVCPMSIKDIKISDRNNILIRDWTLGKHTKTNTIYDKVKNYEALVENPKWLIDQHVFWEKKLNLTFKNLLGTAEDQANEKIYFIEPNELYIYDINTNIIDTITYNNYTLKCQSNNFIYNNLTNQLISYSLDKKLYKTFDFINLRWSDTDEECAETAYHQHNKLVSPLDSTVVTFGGYGYYHYKSIIYNFDVNTHITDSFALSSKITPRYLSSVGKLNDNKFLIYGGYGSPSGKQGVGSQIYNDLYSVNFNDFKAKKLWVAENDTLQPQVPVSSMVVDSNADSFYTLVCNNSNYNTHLNLARYGISEYDLTIYPDSIPYKFLDIKSNVEFFLNSNKSKLNALTIDDNNASLYSLSYPPLMAEDIYQVNIPSNTNFNWIKYLSIFIVLTFLALVFLLIRKKKTNTEISEVNSDSLNEIIHENTNQIKTSAIYLFGGFQVFDKKGEDITAQFTPTLKQLFLIILLSSTKNRKGVSSIKLTDLLWPNKSESKARNNRNVNISKLRLLLDKIGDNINLNNENTYWKIKLESSVFCDYIFVQNILIESTKHSLEKDQVINLLNIISSGEISPDIHTEWIEGFKDDIINILVDDLLTISLTQDDPHLLIRLSNTILKYAPLNEEAISLKCKSLYKLGRKGSAKQCYNDFCKTYLDILDSKYEKSFNEIISD